MCNFNMLTLLTPAKKKINYLIIKLIINKLKRITRTNFEIKTLSQLTS
jgi:hypothetical protein